MQAGEAASPAPLAVRKFAMPVRWGDLDALRHVNNTVYFRFFEEARVRFMDEVRAQTGIYKAFVLAHTECDFMRPLHYPVTVVVQQALLRIGGSSLLFEAVIEREDQPGVACAIGRYTIVGVDGATQRPQPWSDAERALLASL
ncbi:acyl-CoA thioesterase [Pusillimonas sp. TS35]|uniref:acyl-CoA thioesterase n=1 Tax=Paracandidimonas lactea TaxID=2895524 RepID=UPI001370014D|nr:thioesterase family protein [Paracandidimonas lactea]MYN13626.1 acyl-CoA thioesterase [Pusillimonas sp. TS35]